MLEKAFFHRSRKGPRHLVFRRSVLNHLRWLREGQVATPWEEQAEPKVLSGVQRLAEEVRAEEDRRRVMEQQTLLAQELAAKLTLTQESEREYVKAEAELFAAKNLRDEKDERMESLVEQMARKTEETALQKLSHEHEIHAAEMQAEAEAWRRKKDSNLEDFLKKASSELDTLEAQEQQMLKTKQSLEGKVELRRRTLEVAKTGILKATEDIISATPWRTPAKPTDYDCAVVNWWHMVGPDRPAWQVADTLEQRCRSAALRLEEVETFAARALSEEQVLEANLEGEEASAASFSRQNAQLQEQLRIFKLKSSKALAEIEEEEGEAAALKAKLLERQQGQQQLSQEMQHWYHSEEYHLELAQRQLDFDEKNMGHQIELLRNQETRQRHQLRDQEMRDKGEIVQQMEQEMEADKRKLALEVQQQHQRLILRQGQLEHDLQRLQEQLSQDEVREQQMTEAVAQSERRLRLQLHQSELAKQEESQQMQDAMEQEKVLEAQQRRVQELSDKLKDLELQQSILADKEDQLRLDQMERQEQVLRKRQEQQLRMCQVQLQEMRSQQEMSDQQFRSKLERVQRELELVGQRVKDLQEQFLRTHEVAASGKEDPLQVRLIEKKVEEIEKELVKLKEDLLQHSNSMAQQEQRVQDQEEQLSTLQQDVLRELEEHLEKPRERGPEGEELPDSRALRKKLENDREEVIKQIAAQQQQRSLRAEQQQRVIDRLGGQLEVLLKLLEDIKANPVMTPTGREGLKTKAYSTVRQQEEWMQQLVSLEQQQKELFFEEQRRMERYEETAEHWKLEQEALSMRQEAAEEAARDAERQAMEEAARHLAEGKLVPGANLEVILTDPGPVGLTFHADDETPPRVRKVKKDRREFWEKQGMQDGAVILAVGDAPTAHLTSAELLPLLNGRPLRLQFALGPVRTGINSTDNNGQTALHRALENGDEAEALKILAEPTFNSINVQDNLGKTALHWAASGGMGEACKAILSHADFNQEDAVDYRGITAYEDAEGAGQTQVVKIFDTHTAEAADEQEGW
ncbi:unnamed protein product [Durusdinium trenchii]|uniref:Uncharacterized protein n=1 Tax=Durusdinium trenchii TaxID=1381693 RepID=A0ABP0RHU1_9DINO